MRVESPCLLWIQLIDEPKSRSCQIRVFHLEGDPFAIKQLTGDDTKDIFLKF